MGLLSFMPEEKNLKVLQQTIQKYESELAWELYLYKQDSDYIGLVGVEKQDDQLIVRHISVAPSYRSEGVGQQMVHELTLLDKAFHVKACQLTEPFIDKCLNKEKEADMPV